MLNGKFYYCSIMIQYNDTVFVSVYYNYIRYSLNKVDIAQGLNTIKSALGRNKSVIIIEGRLFVLPPMTV